MKITYSYFGRGPRVFILCVNKLIMSKSNDLEDQYPFDISGLFHGLRTLNLSFEASLFELIDNSLGHGEAKKTDVRLEWIDNSNRLSRVAVIDNGIGMDRVTLFRALITGKSNTHNQRNTIGRFGFGLKAGGLNQCRIIEVYSKRKDSDPHYAVLDYDSFLNGKEKMSAPVEKEIPKEFQDIIKEQGTVVIWSNLDIAQAPDQKYEFDELKYEIGRTFRKFIGEEILDADNNGKTTSIKNKNKRTISINGVDAIPWDPLYHTTIPGFEKDPKSEFRYEGKLIVPIHISEEINPDELKKLKKYNFNSTSDDNPLTEDSDGEYGDIIKIRFSILPKEWRTVKGQGDSDFNTKRWIPYNEGISILRAGREVSTKPISGLTGKYDTIDRWWGLEIDYPPTLDRWFQIKNVKVGLEPNKELRKMFNKHTSIKPTKNRAIEKIQDYWNVEGVKKKQEKIICKKCSTKNDKSAKNCSSCNNILTTDDHTDAEDRFAGTGLGRPKIFEDMTDEEKDEYFKQLALRFEDFDATIDRERFEQLNIKFLSTANLPPNASFIDVNPGIGVTELVYNLTHVFFRKINDIMDQQRELSKKLEDDLDEEELAIELKDTVSLMRYCIDLLLASFASAHVSIDPYAKQDAKTTLMSLMSQWTTMLHIVTEDKDFEKRVHD